MIARGWAAAFADHLSDAGDRRVSTTYRRALRVVSLELFRLLAGLEAKDIVVSIIGKDNEIPGPCLYKVVFL